VTERLTLKGLRALFDAKGGCQYSGEAVSQLEHALQCAALAEQAGSAAALITASLLHDVGHMTSTLEGTPTLRGEDDKHQYHGVVALKGVFPDAVLTPIRLHVEAKRYLCAVDAEYWGGLSGDSKRSLVLQGGIYTREEANEFIGQEHAQDAVNLRRWDDLAKVAGRRTPDLDHFLAIARKCAA
jgi:phosphonate degradation associated HDIG domain protein